MTLHNESTISQLIRQPFSFTGNMAFRFQSRRLAGLLREFPTSRSLRREHWQRGTLCKGGSYEQFAIERNQMMTASWRESPFRNRLGFDATQSPGIHACALDQRGTGWQQLGCGDEGRNRFLGGNASA